MDNIYEDYKTQKRLLMEALVERDYMEIYESNLLKNDFILKLGEPRYELHKLELTIARTKLKLEMMQTCVQFQIPIDHQHIDRTLEKEFEKHFNMLRIMKREIDNVHNMNVDNKELIKKAQELKKMYISIAERIHPDITVNPDKKIKRIWKAAKAAYETRDAEKLKKLHKKVMLEYKDSIETLEELEEKSKTDMKKVIKQLKTKTKTIQSEIESLRKQFPFTEAKILCDQEAVERFRKDISIDIKIAKEFLDRLEKQILEKLPPTSDLLQ